jgi:hypothetical protein
VSVVDTWAEQAAEMDTVDEIAALWMAGARDLGLVEEGEGDDDEQCSSIR